MAQKNYEFVGEGEMCIPPNKHPPPQGKSKDRFKAMRVFSSAKHDLRNLAVGDKLHSQELDINAEILERQTLLGTLHYRLKFYKHKVKYEKVIAPAGLHIYGFSLRERSE